ncbi:MAG: serine hydrolase, partial [Victivallales bacterium]|nr:serine hydrolase [Victivallales bacterium]
MNIKSLLTGAAVITIIYIIVFFVFIKGCDKKEKIVEETAVEETTPQQQEQPVEETTQPQETAPTDPLYGVEPYSDEFFTYTTKNIPADVQRAITASNVKAGIAVNLDSREVCWALNPNTAYPMASVTKMMTALVAVRKMLCSNGAITLESPIKVTRAASLIGGRQVWLDPKETFTFDEILKCVLVHSANDCAYLLGEFMGNGDINSFIHDMNKQ